MEIYLLIALAGSLIERQPGATPDEDSHDETAPAAVGGPGLSRAA